MKYRLWLVVLLMSQFALIHAEDGEQAEESNKEGKVDDVSSKDMETLCKDHCVATCDTEGTKDGCEQVCLQEVRGINSPDCKKRCCGVMDIGDGNDEVERTPEGDDVEPEIPEDADLDTENVPVSEDGTVPEDGDGENEGALPESADAEGVMVEQPEGSLATEEDGAARTENDEVKLPPEATENE